MEQFKPFPLNSAVQVGNLGTVIRFNGKPAKVSKHSLGYLSVSVSIEGIVKVMKLHRVVAITWVDNPNSLPEVNHLDGIKTNCEASNLEWSTHADNIRHGRAMGLWTKPTGRPIGYKASEQTKAKQSAAKKGKYRDGCRGKWITTKQKASIKAKQKPNRLALWREYLRNNP